MSLNDQTIQNLVSRAILARQFAYVPYSHHAVGAALLTADHRIYEGCNIENASYTPCNCAERTAFFKAVSEGVLDFTAIAVAGGEAGKPVCELTPPCGVCRQVMMEFCDPETFLVIMAKGEDAWIAKPLSEILPYGFGPANLDKKRGKNA